MQPVGPGTESNLDKTEVNLDVGVDIPDKTADASSKIVKIVPKSSKTCLARLLNGCCFNGNIYLCTIVQESI